MRFLVLILSLFYSLAINALDTASELNMKQPIKQGGQVHHQESTAQLPVPPKEIPGGKTYERYCASCHSMGLVGAPKKNDKKAWSSRLSGRTIDDLVASAVKGVNAMPAKGTCYECNEEEIKSAIEYMLPNHE